MRRKPTVCLACGGPSYNGRACKGCLRYYGGPADNAVAGAALARRMAGCRTIEDALALIGETVDLIVPDWPGVALPRLLHSGGASAADREG